MQTLAFTGPRFLSPDQRNQTTKTLLGLSREGTWLVGCAAGLDALVRELAPNSVLFQAPNRKPWELQRRSKQMIDALAARSGILHAFPNKPCPKGLTLDSWCGSGTWGTILYAHRKGCWVELHPLIEMELPDWLEQEQLSFF